MKTSLASGFLIALALASSAPAFAQAAFTFSTGNVTNGMAVASRPSSSGQFEIEAADDFLLTQQTTLTSATFTGLLVPGPGTPTVLAADIEIYRVFPLDSGIPDGNVPTRVNSPSDVAFASRDSNDGNLTFSTALIAPSFTALNSVAPGGIHMNPNSLTGGNGPLTGQEVQFTVTFTTPLVLPADHYFFVPQVQVAGGQFYWLSASRPLVAPATPFSPDLQAWTRDETLDPDWLRVGTDIVGGGQTFNLAFTLNGSTPTVAPVPEPSTYGMIASAVLLGIALTKRRKNKGATLA